MGLLQAGFKIDIVLVIDSTGSMVPIIGEIKERALTLGDELKQMYEAIGKRIEALRIRVIDFGDFASECTDAIHASEFFTMPDDSAAFENYVRHIDCDCRGGDIPENALEALWVAMQSDWVDLSAPTKGRHIIILLTDAPPLNLRERVGCIGYVADDYPEGLAQMQEIWQENSLQGCGTTKLNPKKKRLVLFAPEGRDAAGHSWDEVSGWEKTIYTPVADGNGLNEVPLDSIIADVIRG